jgi:hypothetical protein
VPILIVQHCRNCCRSCATSGLNQVLLAHSRANILSTVDFLVFANVRIFGFIYASATSSVIN